MDLRLEYPPLPENMARFADDIVAAATRVSGAHLDRSVASLASVDEILGQMRADGVTSDRIGETLFGVGAYVGEVFVHHAAGRWVLDPRFGSMPVIALPGGRLCNPIAKVMKRVDHGEVDSVPYFFQVFTADLG